MMNFDTLKRKQRYEQHTDQDFATTLAEEDRNLYTEVMENVATKQDLKILELRLDKRITEEAGKTSARTQAAVLGVGAFLSLLQLADKFFG